MKINNPLKESSRKNIESFLKNIGARDRSIWDDLEEHNKRYNDDLMIVYDSKTFEPILK